MSLTRVAAVALLVGIVFGCAGTPANPNKVESKCDANNPYLCPDGHACCTSWAPVCKGPDDEGYYCEPEWSDIDDPLHQFSTSKTRVRPQPRQD